MQSEILCLDVLNIDMEEKYESDIEGWLVEGIRRAYGSD